MSVTFQCGVHLYVLSHLPLCVIQQEEWLRIIDKLNSHVLKQSCKAPSASMKLLHQAFPNCKSSTHFSHLKWLLKLHLLISYCQDPCCLTDQMLCTVIKGRGSWTSSSQPAWLIGRNADTLKLSRKAVASIAICQAYRMPAGLMQPASCRTDLNLNTLSQHTNRPFRSSLEGNKGLDRMPFRCTA